MCGKTSNITNNNPEDYELTWREKQLITNYKRQHHDGWTRALPTDLKNKVNRIEILERKVAESANMSFVDFAKTLNIK
jgi:hypothetical protein